MSTNTTIAIKSVYLNTYLHYTEDDLSKKYGALRFYGNDSSGCTCQFELVDAIADGKVHIKYNNKFLRTVDENSEWLSPDAEETEEDTELWTCTLFDKQVHPTVPSNQNHFRFLHVQRNTYAFPASDPTGKTTRFSVASSSSDPKHVMKIIHNRSSMEETTPEVREN